MSLHQTVSQITSGSVNIDPEFLLSCYGKDFYGRSNLYVERLQESVLYIHIHRHVHIQMSVCLYNCVLMHSMRLLWNARFRFQSFLQISLSRSSSSVSANPEHELAGHNACDSLGSGSSSLRSVYPLVGAVVRPQDSARNLSRAVYQWLSISSFYIHRGVRSPLYPRGHHKRDDHSEYPNTYAQGV